MNRFKKVGLLWFFFLVVFCTTLISVILFICQLVVSTLFFFNDGRFIFSCEDALQIALQKGSITGILLGAGVWLKNKLHERQSK